MFQIILSTYQSLFLNQIVHLNSKTKLQDLLLFYICNNNDELLDNSLKNLEKIELSCGHTYHISCLRNLLREKIGNDYIGEVEQIKCLKCEAEYDAFKLIC